MLNSTKKGISNILINYYLLKTKFLIKVIFINVRLNDTNKYNRELIKYLHLNLFNVSYIKIRSTVLYHE